jgi:hypothetical protein
MPGCTTTVAGLHHNGDMWHMSSMLILNCTCMMWKNEQQAGETIGN